MIFKYFFSKNVKFYKNNYLNIKKLYIDIKKIQMDKLNISEYNKNYFNNIIFSLKFNFQLYLHLISKSLRNRDDLKEMVFVDYGGGVGLISILAKALGFGTVIYNDIYKTSCVDAKVIGDRLGYSADYYVNGDIDYLLDFCQKNNINPNIIVSYDVIEHIYNWKMYFEKLRKISKNFEFVFGSSANSKNSRVVKRLMRHHKNLEYYSREYFSGVKKRDTLKAFYTIRKDFIKKFFKDENTGLIKDLSKRTRGMNIEDIKIILKKYKKNGIKPEFPEHSTNTCDPYTGNWAENLIDFDELETHLFELGYDCIIESGFFTNYGKKNKYKIANYIKNIIIRFFPKKSLFFSQFFILKGKYKK